MNIAHTSLADRLVAKHFSSAGEVLVIGDVSVEDLAQTYGTPFFAYDVGVMRASYKDLEQVLGDFADIYFSIKANPNPEIAKVFVDLGAGLEIASGGEFEKAMHAGCKPECMLFAGPAKGVAELEATLSQGLGEIHLESFEEIERVASIAAKLEKTVPVAIRVNPKAAAQGGAMRMGGKATAFGFDEESLPAVVAQVQCHTHLKLTGVHMFAGTQILDSKVLLAQWGHGLQVGADVSEMAGHALQTIDLGGGLGVPYFEGDRPLDLESLAAGITDLRTQKGALSGIANARVIVEPGRFLTAGAGVYVMEVRVAKTSHGERFVICDGGMHHHLAASGNLGQVIKRDFPIVAATKLKHGVIGPVTIAGPLCTPLDTVGRKTEMPDLVAGDLVAILQSGAYGLTASPVGFLSHPAPQEVLVEGGAHRAI